MSEMIEVRIPALSAMGAGCSNCGSCGGQRITIDEIFVAAGEWIIEGDAMITLETNKAIVDVNAPCTGEVLAVLVEAGESVEEGAIFLLLDSTE